MGTLPVTISVRKLVKSGSNTIVFTFACDGNPCTNRTVALSHLSFDKTADFTDTTTVPVQGTVSIAGTKEFNPAGNPCPIEKAKVCAVNHYGANEQLVCRDTDIYGEFCCLVLFIRFQDFLFLFLRELLPTCSSRTLCRARSPLQQSHL